MEDDICTIASRLGNTKFAPGSRAGGIIKQQSSFGRTYSTLLIAVVPISGILDFLMQMNTKASSFPFPVCGSYNVDFGLEKTSGFEHKMSVPFPNPTV